MSDPSWLSSDDAFEAQWNTDADGVIGFLARRYDVQHDLAQRIAKRDAIAWTNSQNSAVLARNDSMRNKIKNRFIVMHKNKTALSDVVNRFGITKGNYYDVGCGFGYTLIVAKELGFRKACGAEVDPVFVRAADELARPDFGSDIEYEPISFFESKQDKRFSLITFIDVLEHIGDVKKAIQQASDMLDNSGVIYWYQGNPLAVDMVLNETHYRLPGLTIVPKSIAVEALINAKKIKGASDYVVAWWPQMSRLISESPVELRLFDDGMNIRSSTPYPSNDTTIDRIHNEVPKILDRLGQYLSQSSRDTAQKAVEAYLQSADRTFKDEHKFRVNYAMHSWNVFHYKQEKNVPPSIEKDLISVSKYSLKDPV